MSVFWHLFMILNLGLMAVVGVRAARQPSGIRCGPCCDGICSWMGCSLPGMCLCDRHEESDMTGKRYGGGAQVTQRLPEPIPFELAGLRYDEEEVHAFTAVRKVDTLLAGRFLNATGQEAAMLRSVLTMIGKTLDNKDGVPVQWSPTPLPKPADAGTDWEPKFRDPEGELRPVAEAEKFLGYDAGSSRRRWEALLADEGFTVGIEVLAEIAKDLIEASADRPTDG